MSKRTERMSRSAAERITRKDTVIRPDRMAEKLYEKGRKDVKRCIRIRKLIRRCMILSAIVTVVLIQYNKNEKLRESLEELLKMFRDRTVNESEEDF